MSMVFAGFMGAAKEDRIRREDLKNEQDKEERSWQKQLDLLDITERKQQEIIDRKAAKDAAAFSKVTGAPYEESLAVVDAYGLATATDLFQSGSLKFNSGSTSSWDGSVSPNAEVMYNKFVELGYDSTVAAGLVGNFMQESGVGINTSAVGDGGASIGAGQWNLSRGDNFKKFAASNNLDIADPVTAALFTDYELKTTEKSALEKIQAASGDPAAVARAASEAFWRPGTPMLNNRMNYATGVFEKLYASKVPALDDTGMGGGGLTFGEDSQMADLGLGSPAPLTMPEPLVDTNPDVTVSTSGMDTEVEPTGFSLVKTEADLSEYIKGANSIADVETRIAEVNLSNKLTQPQKDQLTAELRKHGETLKGLEVDETDLTDAQQVVATIRMPDGTTVNKEVIRTTRGELLELSNGGQAVPVTGEIVGVVSSDNIQQRLDADAQFQKVDEKFIDTQAAFRDLSEQALGLDQLVQRNEAVLTTVGGTVSSVIDRVGNELSVAMDLIANNTDENGMVSEVAVEKAIRDFEEKSGVNSSELDQNARDYAEFKARQLRFAYAFARVANEQSGVGLSNTDLKNALDTVSSGSSYDTFTNSLRSQFDLSVNSVRGRFSDYLNASSTKNRLQIPGSNVYNKTFDQFIEEEGLGDAIDWASDTVATPTAAAEKPADNAAVNNIINSPEKKAQISAFEASIDNSVNEGKITPQTAIKLRADYARKLGLDPQTYESISRMGAN